MWRDDIKCKYMFMFSLKKLACKGLNIKGSVSYVLIQDTVNDINIDFWWKAFLHVYFQNLFWQNFTLWLPLLPLPNSTTESCEPIKCGVVLYCSAWLAEDSCASALLLHHQNMVFLFNLARMGCHVYWRKFDSKLEFKCDEQNVNLRRMV